MSGAPQLDPLTAAGAAIYAAMDAAGIATVAELVRRVERAGLPCAAVYLWTRGIRRPSPLSWRRLRRVLPGLPEVRP